MISNTCKYGLRAVIYVALHSNGQEKLGIKKISEDLDLPGPFLGKIMQLLAKHKILHSIKGPNGGFSLAKPANEITLYDIVHIIDGVDLFNDCLIGIKICENNPAHQELCPFHEKSHHVRDELKLLFKSQTVGDFANGIKSADEILMI
jgi:Rrf2 family iron-sulfur cluster assembly transcriptional regulator